MQSPSLCINKLSVNGGYCYYHTLCIHLANCMGTELCYYGYSIQILRSHDSAEAGTGGWGFPFPSPAASDFESEWPACACWIRDKVSRTHSCVSPAAPAPFPSEPVCPIIIYTQRLHFLTSPSLLSALQSGFCWHGFTEVTQQGHQWPPCCHIQWVF